MDGIKKQIFGMRYNMKERILVKFNRLYDAKTIKVLSKDCLVHLNIDNQCALFPLNKRNLCVELSKMDNVDYVEETGQECNIRYTKHKGCIG